MAKIWENSTVASFYRSFQPNYDGFQPWGYLPLKSPSRAVFWSEAFDSWSPETSFLSRRVTCTRTKGTADALSSPTGPFGTLCALFRSFRTVRHNISNIEIQKNTTTHPPDHQHHYPPETRGCWRALDRFPYPGLTKGDRPTICTPSTAAAVAGRASRELLSPTTCSCCVWGAFFANDAY